MIMNEQTWNFVRQHRNDDVRKLALQKVKDQETDLSMALQQIAGWQTARKKLPTWAAREGIVFPPHLNMEQCSSEQTARYKQHLVERLMSEKGDTKAPNGDEMECFVDLTGGFGVDFYWMSQGFKQRCYIEQNANLCALAKHNFSVLGHKSTVVCGSAADFLPTLTHTSVVFIDPARRDEHGARTYGISDCTPNVLEMLPVLLVKGHFIVLKLSPMLDWRKAVNDLEEASLDPKAYVREVHIVSVDNECKELLLVLSQEQTEQVMLTCVNNDTIFHAVSRAETYGFLEGNRWFLRGKPKVSAVQKYDNEVDLVQRGYLYEPNASIMKAGCFRELEQQFPVRQLAANSHLFISADEIADFPGRGFQISAISSMNKQGLKTTLQGIEKANISVRNFPMTADQLRKKLKLKDGGDVYIFATTMADEQHKLFICRKIG